MAEEQKQEFKFPTEVVDLPSGGKMYPEGHPLREGKVEVKYMTAKEEDILTSSNLIKKGIVIDKLLDSLMVSKDIKVEDLLVGDKNAIMIAARILAYGPEYKCEISNPNDLSEKFEHTFDLSEVKFKECPTDVDYSSNSFEMELPLSKNKITFKMLTGRDETSITQQLKSLQKIGQSQEVTTRLKHLITSVNGSTDVATINSFCENMLSKESLFLRDEVNRINPDVELKQVVEIGGEPAEVDIPMTVAFFWPKSGT